DVDVLATQIGEVIVLAPCGHTLIRARVFGRARPAPLVEQAKTLLVPHRQRLSEAIQELVAGKILVVGMVVPLRRAPDEVRVTTYLQRLRGLRTGWVTEEEVRAPNILRCHGEPQQCHPGSRFSAALRKVPLGYAGSIFDADVDQLRREIR